MKVKAVWNLLVFVGLVLFCVSLLGDLSSLGGYDNAPPRGWERFDGSLASRTHSVEDLIKEAEIRAGDLEALSDEQKMMSLYGIVIDRFTHNAGANHTIFTNWILALAGNIHPVLGHMRDPDVYVSKGHSLICSQSSYLLIDMALRSGVSARHAGLNGHVVMEAWYDDDWHMFDPDMEVVPRDDTGRVLGVDELARNKEVLEMNYAGEKSAYVPIIASREDNTFISLPVGAYFEYKSWFLFYIEKVMQVLKYFLPLLFVFTGLYMLRRIGVRSVS